VVLWVKGGGGSANGVGGLRYDWGGGGVGLGGGPLTTFNPSRPIEHLLGEAACMKVTMLRRAERPCVLREGGPKKQKEPDAEHSALRRNTKVGAVEGNGERSKSALLSSGREDNGRVVNLNSQLPTEDEINGTGLHG